MYNVDPEIGEARLRMFMRKWHRGRIRHHGGRLYEELWTPDGTARIDMAYLGDKFEGLEFKGDRDNCDRLPQQIKAYNKVFDTVTIVTGQKLAQEVADIVPAWWGLAVARPLYGMDVGMQWTRLAKPNPSRNPVCLAGFLWRDEAIAEVERLTGKPVAKSVTRAKLAVMLTSLLDVEQLSAIVARCFLARPQESRSVKVAKPEKQEPIPLPPELFQMRTIARDPARLRRTQGLIWPVFLNERIG